MKFSLFNGKPELFKNTREIYLNGCVPNLKINVKRFSKGLGCATPFLKSFLIGIQHV
jgi:hypothetical protein